MVFEGILGLAILLVVTEAIFGNGIDFPIVILFLTLAVGLGIRMLYLVYTPKNPRHWLRLERVRHKIQWIKEELQLLENIVPKVAWSYSDTHMFYALNNPKVQGIDAYTAGRSYLEWKKEEELKERGVVSVTPGNLLRFKDGHTTFEAG